MLLHLEWKQQLDVVKGELYKSQATANDNIEQANRAKSELEELKEKVVQSEGMMDEPKVLCMEEVPPTDIFYVTSSIDLKKQLEATSDELERLKTSISEKDEDATRTQDILEDMKRQLTETEGMIKYKLYIWKHTPSDD
jgi:chromosome segregation ATPase